MANRLANQTSPYLLQHAENPVDWYPWGPEALRRARDEDKPILLSIGYSSCHWCHVLNHESFENPRIAELMNRNFVNIKVDREERPDIDAIYMDAVQALTGHGGWPLTVFLTPEGKPFYGGTYFPPEDRQGMPGFARVLEGISELYREQRDQIEQSATSIEEHLSGIHNLQMPPASLTPETLDEALKNLRRSYDRQHGGFGGAPKFPQPMVLEFVLRMYHRTNDLRILDMVSHTLDQMADGGIYDHLAGGFHRYSVDAEWLIPHFEKMLYDNAQLARLYLDAWKVTENERYRQVTEETLDYVQREMTSPEGGFYSTQDADSEGVEGKYYVWTPQEVRDVLGPDDAAVFDLYYHITQHGNFEGANVLSVPRPLDTVAQIAGLEPGQVLDMVTRGRKKLLEARQQRVPPGKDTKVLTAWNGLMLRAFAEAATALGRQDYLETAVRNAQFLTATMIRDGRVLRSYNAGQAHLNGYLEDYAFLADGLVSLYETTFDLRWLEAAHRLADVMLDEFWDPELPGFYDTGVGHEQLFTRPRSLYDNAIPSGNSVACGVLLRLGALLGETRYQDVAARVLESMAPIMAEHPTAFGRLLCDADTYLDTPLEVAILGQPTSEDTKAMLDEVYPRYLPSLVLAAAEPSDARAIELIAILQERPQVDGRATAYVCHHYMCQQPVTSPEELRSLLDQVSF